MLYAFFSGVFLDFFICDHPVLFHVYLVTKYHLWQTLILICKYTKQPIIHRLERTLPRHVVRYYDAICLLVEAACQISEPLLPRCVPKLKLYFLTIWHLVCQPCLGHSYTGYALCVEWLACVGTHYAGFANASITYDQDVYLWFTCFSLCFITSVCHIDSYLSE